MYWAGQGFKKQFRGKRASSQTMLCGAELCTLHLLPFHVESGSRVFSKCCYLLSANSSEIVPVCSSSIQLSVEWLGIVCRKYNAESHGLETVWQRLSKPKTAGAKGPFLSPNDSRGKHVDSHFHRCKSGSRGMLCVQDIQSWFGHQFSCNSWRTVTLLNTFCKEFICPSAIILPPFIHFYKERNICSARKNKFCTEFPEAKIHGFVRFPQVLWMVLPQHLLPVVSLHTVLSLVPSGPQQSVCSATHLSLSGNICLLLITRQTGSLSRAIQTHTKPSGIALTALVTHLALEFQFLIHRTPGATKRV